MMKDESCAPTVSLLVARFSSSRTASVGGLDYLSPHQGIFRGGAYSKRAIMTLYLFLPPTDNPVEAQLVEIWALQAFKLQAPNNRES